MESPGKFLSYTLENGNFSGQVEITATQNKLYDPGDSIMRAQWVYGFTGEGGIHNMIENNTGIAKFRVISQAARFQLLNTDEENDGWWEAVRVPYLPDMTDWDLNWTGTGRGKEPTMTPETKYHWLAPAENITLRPSAKMWKRFRLKNIAENNTYHQGLLKDLKTRYFTLGNISPNHDFSELEKKFNSPTTASYQYLTKENYESGRFPELGKIPGHSTLVEGTPKSKEIFRSLMDTTTDIIYLRIHPGNSGSNILCELKSNQEHVFGIDEGISKYQLRTPQPNPYVVDTARSARDKTTTGASMDSVTGPDIARISTSPQNKTSPSFKQTRSGQMF